LLSIIVFKKPKNLEKKWFLISIKITLNI